MLIHNQSGGVELSSLSVLFMAGGKQCRAEVWALLVLSVKEKVNFEILVPLGGSRVMKRLQRSAAVRIILIAMRFIPSKRQKPVEYWLCPGRHAHV